MVENKTIKKAPESVRIRMYEVGHGDCFLLKFRYQGQADRHVLIDCGTTAATWQEQYRRLREVASDIKEECGGKLDVVVATHPHRDHIGGFARSESPTAPGAILSALRPRLVLMPWTEDPKRSHFRYQSKVAATLHRALKTSTVHATIPNQRAVESLQRLGRRRKYLHAGMDSGLDELLPGVRVHVLGPAAERKADRKFWKAAIDGPRPKRKLFPNAPQWHPCLAPPQTRWFIDRLSKLQEEQLIALAQSLNEAVNNTSLILLFQFGEHNLLFPGDAESAAWHDALQSPFVRKMIARTTVYKASHHGKANGSPQQLARLLEQPLVLLSSRETEAGVAGYAKLVGTPAARASQRRYIDIELTSDGGSVELERAA